MHWVQGAYNIEWLEHVLHVFEFFGFKSCVNAIDHIVVCLLLLLLHLGELLKVLLSEADRKLGTLMRIVRLRYYFEQAFDAVVRD